MKITVILCTYNRCDRLAKALESAAVQRLSGAVAWDVLVVDNNSRDRTREVVEEFSRKFPGRFRYRFEGQPGKSHALNAGLRDCDADILAFMDDDVTVDADWLERLTAGLAGGRWAGAGGSIVPDRSFTPPSWLPVEDRYGLAPLALFNLGPEAGPLLEPPFGTNMAFRREMFDQYGEFRTDLGPQPGSEIRGEDTEFGRRLLNAGEQLRYEPLAVVYHSIAESRLRKEYFLRWWFDKARSDFRDFGVSIENKRAIAGIPLYLFRRLIIWTLRWAFSWKPSSRFSCRLKVWGVAGQIAECRQQRRSHSKRTDPKLEAI
jgi:glycosyltransferase involved in cell wall biosynthesis